MAGAKRKSPYVRIVEAAKRGKGVVLSADEVANLSLDSAIENRAFFDMEPDVEAAMMVEDGFEPYGRNPTPAPRDKE